MTDPGTADRTYIGPMNPELVEEIIAKVSRLPSALVKLGLESSASAMPSAAGCCVSSSILRKKGALQEI